MRTISTISALIFLITVFAVAPAFAVDVQAIQKANIVAGASWTAGETAVSDLPYEELKGICNLPLETPDVEGKVYQSWPGSYKKDVPNHLDWRDVSGRDFLTSIKDQHPCGSCATFSTVGMVESHIKILNDNEFIEPNLSEQIVWSCAGGLMPPASFFHTLGHLKNDGTSDEACYPYEVSQCADSQLGRLPCDGTCSDWQIRAWKIRDYQFYMWAPPETFIQALQTGPIVAGFMVYEDFTAYTDGVYEHTSGKMLGGHAVVVVGYDINEEYWICKNSWSQDWGMDGFFKVAWRESALDFGYQAASIDVDYGFICGANTAPELSSLTLGNNDLDEGQPLEFSFAYNDTQANLAGGELFYAIDGESTRFPAPLEGFVGTTSEDKTNPIITVTSAFPKGEHTLSLYVNDLCGESSNLLETTFTVGGPVSDDDDDDTNDDDDSGDDDDDTVSDADGDDDDDDSGCCG